MHVTMVNCNIFTADKFLQTSKVLALHLSQVVRAVMTLSRYLSHVFYSHVPCHVHRLDRAYNILYSSTSTSWRRRGLKRVPRSDLD